MRRTLALLTLAGMAALAPLATALAGQSPCSTCPSGTSASAELFFAAGPAPEASPADLPGVAGASRHHEGKDRRRDCEKDCHSRRDRGDCAKDGAGPCGGPGCRMKGAEGDCGNCWKALGLEGQPAGQAQALCRASQKEAVTLAARLKVAEMDLEEALAAEKPDLKAVETRIREAEGVRAQLRISRVSCWLKINALLTPEQKTKLQGWCLTPSGKPCPPERCGQMPGMLNR